MPSTYPILKIVEWWFDPWWTKCHGDLVPMVNYHHGDSNLEVKHLPGWKPLVSKYLHGELFLGVSWPRVKDDWGKMAQVNAHVYPLLEMNFFELITFML